MINITPQIRMNHANINYLKSLANQAVGMTAEALRTDIYNNQLMPFDTGALQNDLFVNRSRINQGIASLDSTKHYAARVYFHPEFNFQKVNNANAQALWYEMYQVGGSKSNFCSDTFAKIYRQLLNGSGGGV